RVTAVVARDDSVVRVIAYARLSLFGPGAARLHDEILAVAGPWPAGRAAAAEDSGSSTGPGSIPAPEPIAIAPYRDSATAAQTIARAEALLAGSGQPPNARLAGRIAARGPALFAALWPAVEAEADARAVAANNGLRQRADRESDELRALLEQQKRAIERAAGRLRQGELFATQDSDTADLAAQKRQVRLDLDHMDRRRQRLDDELLSEPAAIAELYEVRMTRLAPIGLVVTWPEALT
ncbi:MAG: hypothetical protein AAGC55_22110, partial [Myxococcota bacterium]